MDARGRRFAHCESRGGDEPILTSELSEVFHGVELSVAKQRRVVVLAEVDWWRVMEECGIARACPYPGIELRQRDPPSAFHVKVFIAASVDLIAEHIVPPDLAEERVGEANEEPWAEWDPLSPACAREERVEPDLKLEDGCQRTDLGAAVPDVLGVLMPCWLLVFPIEVWGAIGERLRAEVVSKEGDVLRD